MERLVYAIILTLIAALASGRLSYPNLVRFLTWQASITQIHYAY